MGSNLPAVLEVTLGGHSSGRLTIPIGTRPWHGQSELILRFHYVQATESADNGTPTLALKLMDRAENRVPVAPQNGDIVTAKKEKKKEKKQ